MEIGRAMGATSMSGRVLKRGSDWDTRAYQSTHINGGTAMGSDPKTSVVDLDHAEAARLYERRLVLVRPDGQVAWRGDAVPADTTALMIGVYSDWVFGDTSLYAAAEEAHRRVDLTLLTALDLPWQADGHQRDGAHVRAPIDALVRAALGRAGSRCSDQPDRDL